MGRAMPKGRSVLERMSRFAETKFSTTGREMLGDGVDSRDDDEWEGCGDGTKMIGRLRRGKDNQVGRASEERRGAGQKEKWEQVKRSP